MPEQFGTIAIVMVFISLRVFVQSGFNTALIQRRCRCVDFHLFLLESNFSRHIIFDNFLSAPYIANL